MSNDNTTHVGTLFNINRNYKDRQCMFGEGLGIYDAINRKDTTYYDLYQRNAAQFWSSTEFDFSPCKKEFAKGDTAAQAMIDVISYQLEADSVAAMAILPVLAPFITNNDLFQLLSWVTMIEQTHSDSYALIVRNSFDKPDEVLDTIIANQEATKRLGLITRTMDEVFEVSHKYALGMMTKEEAFPYAYKGVVALALLEKLQFLASFAITFALGNAGMFQPIALCVRKIANDELLHGEGDLLIVRDMRTLPYWEKTNTLEFQEEIKAMIDEAVEGEMAWTDFVFRDNSSLVGVTPNQIKEYVNYLAQVIYKELGFTPPVKVKENPIKWIEFWMSNAQLQTANQEIEAVNYNMAAIQDDSAEAEFDF